MTVEEYIEKYGEHYRALISDSLAWLDDREAIWKLDEPINRDEFVRGLTHQAKVR